MTASRLRLLFVACAGIGTFYAAAQWSRSQHDDGTVDAPPTGAVAHSARAAASAASAAGAPDERDGPLALRDRTRVIPDSRGDAFTSLSWLPPPPPPPPLPPPPPPKPAAAPTAPPLPYAFVGMLQKGPGKPAAFLSRGDALLIVSAGDVLDNNTYRVESLGNSEVVLTYLPLNIKQSINISWEHK